MANNQNQSVKYDFGGYATKANVRCTDGRVISRDAFKDCDGKKVPLVFQHLRNDPKNIVGHAILENRPDGVYAYGKFNNSETAKTMKELVEHGDIDSLSIYANHLSQHGSNVVHGAIREVSLVVAGANPGAKIDNLCIQHDDGYDEQLDDEAIITLGENIEHGDIYLKTKNTAEEDASESDVEHADDESQNEAKVATVKEVFDSLNEDQKVLFYAMVGQALEESAEEDVEQSDENNEGGINMVYHAFENNGSVKDTISHEDRAALFKYVQDTAKKNRLSFRDVLRDVVSGDNKELQHGITDIESLFPDYKSLNNPPAWIGEPEAWVNTVWNGTSKTPFSRIKSAFADITKDEARARGYIKGKKKIEEQFSLLKRTTGPQTIYKLQKLDRDDIIDITDFDVVAWLKSEMRMKLQEELARAILIGDGRLSSDDSKISEDHIRSVLNDDPFYSLKFQIALSATMDSTDRANAILDGAAYALDDYKGSGSLTAYMSPSAITDMKVAKDKNGRRLYNNMSDIADALGVDKIVRVPAMKDQTRYDDDTKKTYRTLGILVNLRDYNVGADRGGQTTMFDDFDIDYNKYAYLIETRCSGALIRPASAIVLETEFGVPTTPILPSPPDDDDEDQGVG